VSDDRWTWASRVALAIGTVPIVVAVVRAIVTGWVPLFDGAYFTVRSRDVLTSHHPVLGAWSSGSAELDTPLRNMGPLQLDLMAPFTKLDPYWGTALANGLVALAAVVAVWSCAGRVLGPRAAAAAMLATLVVEALIGSAAFIDPRQQTYLLMPFWALLWLTWALAVGQRWAVGPTVLAASLIVQTHFTYVYQSMLLVAAGVGGFLWCHRQRWGEAVRPAVTGAVVAVVCWSQPLWDQVAGDGNLGAVLAGSDARPGLGLPTSTRIVAGAVLLPESWALGAVGSFDLPADLASATQAVLALAMWSLVVAAAVAVSWRAGRSEVAALGAMGAVALLSGVVATMQIPTSGFGLISQNYFWLWPLVVFVASGIAMGAVAGLLHASPRTRPVVRSPATAGALVAASIVVAAIGCREVLHFSIVASEVSAGSRVAPTLVDELRASLAELDVEGPLTVDLRRASFGSYFRYTVLAELQRAGIEFRFPPDDRNLDRFGDDRCADDAGAGRLVLTDAGQGIRLRRGEVLLAHVDALGDDDRSRLDQLERTVAARINDGTIGIDLEGLEFLAGGPLPEVRDLLDSPDAPVDDLAIQVDGWRRFGAVRVPAALAGDVDDWIDLTVRSQLEVVAVILAPAQAFLLEPESTMTDTTCPT